MSEFISWLICLAWGVRICWKIVGYTALWYIKEYRVDRMLVHSRTRQGRFVFFDIGWKVPPISPKTIVLMALLVLSSISLWMLLPGHWLLKLFVIDISLFFQSMLFVVLLTFPTALYHEILIYRAVRKLRAHPGITVIGITGSYGKTSTKDFLATVLSSTYTTVKTEASKNSPIAIAELILRKLTSDTQVFVVEMAAYKRGEIRRMCDMVRPEIGIITAINEQHQDLFGSIETTMEAKYELFDGLVGKRVAICNADNEYTIRLAKRAMEDGCRVLGYSKQHNMIKGAREMLYATNIQSSLEGVKFEVSDGNKGVAFRAPVIGEYQVSNLLAAISASKEVGMSLTAIRSGIEQVKPPQKVMQPLKGVSGSIIINDTFNNNPDAAVAALDVLRSQKKKKIFVFQPMIELGTYADSAHIRVGEYAGRVCDYIFLTNHNFETPFRDGVKRSGSSTRVTVDSARIIASEIRSIVQKGDTVLCKGKESEAVLNELLT